MPNTHGFEVVAEVSEATLQEFLHAAWDNGGTGDEGSFPHEVEIPASSPLPPYEIESGQASIPKSGLSLQMAPADNGVTVKINTQAQINLKADTVPVESLELLDISADISVTAPIDTIPGSEPNIGVIFEGLARSKVSVTLLNDPIGPITTNMIEEFIHNLYMLEEPEGEADAFPHTENYEDLSWAGIATFDVFVEFFSDPDTLENKIIATMPDSDHVAISIPTHLKLYNITSEFPIQTPMGVTARIIVTAPFDKSSTQITATLSSATVEIENIQPADGIEGTNYNTNKSMASLMGINLEELMKTEIASRGTGLIQGMEDIVIKYPSNTQIETIIGEYVHSELLARKYFGVWTPNTPEGSPVDIESVRPKALSNALAIAINPKNGANEDLLSNFIPSGSKFAIAFDEELVNEIIQETIDKPEDEGGLGGIPKTYPDIEGYKCKVESLNWELQSGKIHFWGDVKVYDVFCGADADVSFWADIGLKWLPPDSTGAQTLEPYVIDKDADLPWWAWLIAVLTFLVGVIVGIIAVVITAVVEGIVEKVGGSVMEDEVSSKLQTIGAWPQQLQGIGTVETEFNEDVGIDSGGLLFSGPIETVATHSQALTYSSDAGGPYSGKAAHMMNFHPGLFNPNIDYNWKMGDGAFYFGSNINHTYIENGLYILRLAVDVQEPGGIVTHHHAPVEVKNVPPVVEAGKNIEANEGDEIIFVGSFLDDEYVDTHEAYWDFGDDSSPGPGVVNETNNPPKATGTVTGSHAYCDNGEYTVTLQVRDDDGGVGYDTLKVKVNNVPPQVDAGDIIFAYPCCPINLIGKFIDPGWCDKHTAKWHFGEIDNWIPATVYEVNEPPFGYGIAVATHTYHNLGFYCAECVVRDDDGGVGRDKICVHVIDIKNKNFEEGFRNRVCGEVANDWHPYQFASRLKERLNALVHVDISGPAVYKGEEFVVREGQRSQNIKGTGSFHAGIMQKIGANPGWDYQIVAWYHLDENHNGKCRLGIDPTGGADPNSPNTIWVEGANRQQWSPLTVRRLAKERLITIYLEVVSEGGVVNGYFDKVELSPFPCKTPMPKRPEQPKPKPQGKCADWKDELKSYELREPYEKGDFVFNTVGDAQLQIVQWGEPENTGKLKIPQDGLRVQLPFEANRVVATCIFYTKKEMVMKAFNSNGDLVNTVTVGSDQAGSVFEFMITGETISYVIISGGGNEALLIKICAYWDTDVTEEKTVGRPKLVANYKRVRFNSNVTKKRISRKTKLLRSK